MPKRLSPQQLVLGIGVAVAIFTALSGLAAAIFQFKSDDPVSRTVFLNIPDALVFAFYIVLPVIIVYGAWVFSLRVKNWERGGPDNRSTTAKNAKKRAKSLRQGLYMQTLLREPGAGIMHSMMYFSFVVLLLSLIHI